MAYGTSRRTESLERWEFLISEDDGELYRLSGLSRPTKFSFRKVVMLDYTRLWFKPAPGQPQRATPLLGTLHPALLKRAEAAFRAAGDSYPAQ